MCAMPVQYIVAFNVNILGMTAMGHKNIMVTNPRNQKSLVKAFKKHRPTFFPGINSLYETLLNNEDFCKLKNFNLKISTAAGMAVLSKTSEMWEKVTGCYLAQGMGLTEACPIVAWNPLDGSGQKGTVGVPIPSTDMRIVGKDGRPMLPGYIGEIEVAGPQVMKGYYNDPERTERTLVNGWLKTGDIGHMTKKGYFVITDRKKDMIFVFGN